MRSDHLVCHGDAGHLVTWRKVEQIVASGLAEKKDALCRAVHVTALCWAERTAASNAELAGASG